jgi:hypothetical protein
MFRRSSTMAGRVIAAAICFLALSTAAPVQGGLVAPDLTLDTADATSGWTTGSNNTLAADAEIKVHGTRSLKSSGGSGVRFRKLFTNPVDVSRFKYVKFWYYVDRPDRLATTGDTGQIEISSSTTDDQQEWFWNVDKLNLQRGWNFILLDLPGSVRRGPVDATKIRRIRIYHASTAAMTVRIDHVTFSNREPRSSSFAEYLKQKRMAASQAAVEQEDEMYALAQRASPGSPERNRVCRFLRIDYTHRLISSYSLEKLGVARATLDGSLAQHLLVQQFVCNDRSPAPGELTRALQLMATADVAVVNSVATLFGMTSEAASATVQSQLSLDLSRILSTCGGNDDAVANYIRTGALPPRAFPGLNILVPQCTGGAGEISIAIGRATEPTIADRRANFQQCMTAFENFGTQCDNPYANPDDEFEGNLARNNKLTEQEKQEARNEVNGVLDTIASITVEDARASGEATHADPEHPAYEQLEELHEELDQKQGQIEYTQQAIDHYKQYLHEDADAEGASGHSVRTDAIVERLEDELVRLSDEQDENFRDICAINPEDDQCPAYMRDEPEPSDDPPPAPPSDARCASMSAGDGQNYWFNTPATPGSPGGVNPFAPRAPQINEADRIDHCLCQLFDRAYNAKLPGDIVQLPSNCPTPEERIAQKCLENPQDGIDGIRAECRHLMQPITLDRDAQAGKWCKLIRPSCDSYLQDDDDCGCGTIRADGTMPLPGCPTGIPNCIDGIPVQDRFGNCGCQPFDSGANQCTPGGKDLYLAADPVNDLRVRAFPQKAGFGNDALLVTRPGSVRFVTPGMRRSQLPGNGSQLLFNAGLVGNSADKTGNIRVYCTNTSASAANRNRLIETIPLSSLSTTGLTTLSINLNSTERDICYGSNSQSNVHFEFFVESAPTQSVGFLDILGGLGNIKPACINFPPGPTPGPRPLSSWPATWTLSNGVSITPKFNGVGALPPIESPPIGGVCIKDGIPVPCS